MTLADRCASVIMVQLKEGCVSFLSLVYQPPPPSHAVLPTINVADPAQVAMDVHIRLNGVL